MAWPRRKARERAKRVRLLNTALDAIRHSAVERTRSIDAKSSFVVIAAGVLAGATLASLVTARTYYIGLIPFALTTASVIASIVALWPTKLWAPSGRLVVDTWVDDPIKGVVLDDYLLEVKAREVEARDVNNEHRATATKTGLILLAASLVSALAVVGINAATL